MKQKFARYASLNILSMVGIALYFLVDTFFISKACGPNGLTALNLAIPAYSFMHGAGLMLGMGGATRYNVTKTSGNPKEADKAFSVAVYAAIGLSLLFVGISLLWSAPITRALGANAEVYDMTHTYLKIILLFSPAFMLNDVMTAVIRNDGAPRLAMIAVISGSLANILGDYILIFPMGLGMLGAVLATGLSPVISLLILSSHIFRKRNGFRLRRTWSWGRFGQICAIGFPSFVGEFATGIVVLIFNFLILRLAGNIGVAAYGIVTNLSLVAIYLLTGLAQGMQPLVSESYGNGDRKGMHTYKRYALYTLAVLSVGIYLIFFFLADPIAAVFNSQHNDTLQAMAVYGMKLYFTALPFAGYNLICSMYFSSAERPVPAQIISLCRGLFVIIPMAFLLAYLAGMTGVWLAFPVTEAVVAGIGLVLTVRERKREKQDSGSKGSSDTSGGGPVSQK